MATIQLNFTLRTSSNCKSVHLVGTWDGYSSQLPLSRDKEKSGGWKGTFRFPGTTMQQGKRYWYYYIIDGHHVSHDPARESIVEPTSGRKLNIIDIPPAKAAAKAAAPVKTSSHKRHSSTDVPKGRSLSPSQIKSPQPKKPHETRAIAHEKFSTKTVEALTHRLAAQQLNESSDDDSSSEEEDSDAESDVPSLSSRSSNSSTPSSVSSTSSCCTCERYGITRAGNRVKLDCGGDRCGYSDASSECSSESEAEYRRRTTRRQGMVVRK